MFFPDRVDFWIPLLGRGQNCLFMAVLGEVKLSKF